MIIGNKPQFAIECYHDLIEGHRHWVFGRMCFWINGNKLGDIEEEQCALCVTKGHIDDALKLLGETTNLIFIDKTDLQCFEFLNKKLYDDNERSDLEVAQDSIEYSKFIFLTHGGESFDRSKSFIIPGEKSIRFIWRDEKCNFSSGSVDLTVCENVFKDWCNWFNAEKG